MQSKRPKDKRLAAKFQDFQPAGTPTSRINLSRFRPSNHPMYPTKSIYVQPKSGRVVSPLPAGCREQRAARGVQHVNHIQQL